LGLNPVNSGVTTADPSPTWASRTAELPSAWHCWGALPSAGGPLARLGAEQVKLEWEVKPLGELFDGADTGQSASWSDTGTAGVQLNELVDGLAHGADYHWRVRA